MPHVHEPDSKVPQIAIVAFLSATIGAIVATLVTPLKGSDTRQAIKTRSTESATTLKSKLARTKDATDSVSGDAQNELKTTVRAAKTRLRSTATKVKDDAKQTTKETKAATKRTTRKASDEADQIRRNGEP